MADSESVVVFTMVTQIRKKARLGDWLSDASGGGNIALEVAEEVCRSYDSLGEFLEEIMPSQAAISVSVDGGKAGMAFVVWNSEAKEATTFLRASAIATLSEEVDE